MHKQDIILVTGARGLVGGALVRHLQEDGFTQVVGLGAADCDLADRKEVLATFERIQPAYVFHAAGYVFGIMGNILNQGESYLQNTLINTHVIDACHKVKVKKITAMGTVAMYPYPMPSDPLREDTIWMGEPHGSERGYAHAKRGMLAQLDAYQQSYGLNYAMAFSTNLYGPHDRFNVETGHVIPSLVRKFFESSRSGRKIVVWGDGSAKRDFLYIKDAVNGLKLIMDSAQGPINLASGNINSIRDVVTILARYTSQEDRVEWDAGKPSGQLYRSYDLSKLRSIEFSCGYSLERGLHETFDWYAANHAVARA